MTVILFQLMMLFAAYIREGSEMKTVSIIVPIYHGKKHIPDIIKQIELCVARTGKDVELELILSNDYPEDSIESIYNSDIIDIVIINSDRNRGIQGARIEGLNYSSAEYIVFLDQDDRIYPDYFASQLKKIGNADAVVCKAVNEGKPGYDVDLKLENIITKEYMLTYGDPIISTGPVLMRRNAIPNIWKENILNTSGADDYFLWLCMIGDKKKINVNNEILFEHIVDGSNTSFDSIRMFESEKEVFKCLKDKEVFSGEDLLLLDSLAENIAKRRIRNLDKFHKMFYVLNGLLLILEEKDINWTYLSNKNIAVYGNSYIGQRVYGMLTKAGIVVECYVDKNADEMQAAIPVYTKENIPNSVNVIVISIMQGEDMLRKELRQMYYDKEIITITELKSRILSK